MKINFNCKFLFIVLIMALFSFSCKVRSIALNETSLVLGLGDTYQLVAVVDPAGAAKSISWETTDGTVLTVDQTGKVEAIAAGTVTVTAKIPKSDLTASCKIEVKPEFYIRASDISISSITFKGYKYKIFESEESFLKKVQKAYPIGTELVLTDFTVTELNIEEKSFIFGKDILKKDFKLVEGTFGVEKDLTGTAGQEYSRKFEFTIKNKDVSIPFKWVAGTDDIFKLPEAGKILFVNDDFTIEDIDVDNKSLNLVLKGLKTKISNSFENVESGDGTITLKVKNNEKIIKTLTAETISDRLVMSIDTLEEDNKFTIEVEITLTSTGAVASEKIENKVNIPYKLPIIVNKTISINPLFISIARVTDEQGVPSDKASALLNYGAEMEYLLKTELGADYAKYDFDNAIWSGKIVKSDNNAQLAEIIKAPYKKRVEFNFPKDNDYNVKLTEGILEVNGKNTEDNLKAKISLNWTSEVIWGDTIEVKKDAEFPTEIYFDSDYQKGTSGRKYVLAYGDDFNYHFNGLNYKNYDHLDKVKSNEALDKEAYEYSKFWGDVRPYARTNWGAWDIRNRETKNSRLMAKILAQNVDKGEIYMGYNTTKPVSGYTDLVKGKNKNNECVMAGASRSKTVRFGYVEARMRSKKKGYHTSVFNGTAHAFWLHGDMHEYDLMEFLGKEGVNNNAVVHWHNGWGNYGKDTPTSSFFKHNFSNNYENEWWTLSLYWDSDTVIYYYNNKELFRIKDLGNKIVQTFKNGAANQRSTNDRTDVYKPTTYNKSLTPQFGGTGLEGFFNSPKMKGVLDVPMNIIVSCNIETWAQSFNAEKRNYLPTWLEVDYVAYYLPEANVEGLKITNADAASDKLIKVGESKQLEFEYVPVHATASAVTWESSADDIASVDANGNVLAKKPGNVTIKLKSAGKETSVNLTVYAQEVVLNSISLDNNTLEMYLDETVPIKLNATFNPTDATFKEVEWSSLDTAIASVSNDGTVTAKGPGTTTISVTSKKNYTVKDECVVTVKRREVLAPNNVTIGGTTYTLVKAFDFKNQDGITINQGTSTIETTYVDGEAVLNFPATKTPINHTMDFALGEGAVPKFVEIRAKVSNNTFTPVFAIETYKTALIKNAFNGTVGNGFAFFATGAPTNQQDSKTEVGVNKYHTFGYKIDTGKTHNFTFDHNNFITLTSTSTDSPTSKNSYSFFINQQQAGAGVLTIEYIAFYNENN